MKRPLPMLVRPLYGLLAILAVLPFGACDEYDPTWLMTVDSTALYSLARPEFIGRPGAYDFANGISEGGGGVIVERADPNHSADFDFAISEIDGELVALPGGMFEGFDIEPGIAIDSSGVAFDDWDLAPRSDYITDEPVPLRTGVLYAVRSRPDLRRRCPHYGKFEVVSLGDGVVELRAVRNHLCNDRELIPPEEN